MELSAETIGSAISGVGVIAACVKWAAVRFAKLERENRESQARLTEEHERAQKACRADNAALVMRLEKIEDRAHIENRDERGVMLKTLQLNAQAFSKLAERIPDPTPPEGTKR